MKTTITRNGRGQRRMEERKKPSSFLAKQKIEDKMPGLRQPKKLSS
jgi:hypothetical protein